MNSGLLASDLIVALRDGDGLEIPVRLRINPRAGRVSVRIDPKSRMAIVTAPNRRHIDHALAFAEQRIHWIAAQLRRLPAAAPLSPGRVFPLRDRPCRIEWVERPGGQTQYHPPASSEEMGRLIVPARAEELVAPRARRWLVAQARADLAQRVSVHAGVLSVRHGRISVKDTRSRWGSCTAAGDLAFSWRLILAPASVLDYVAAHEVAHLIHMDHSAAFWAAVRRCCSRMSVERAWLKAHGARLLALG